LKEKARYIIIGAGLTGLSAAYHLGDEYIVFEKEDTVGGLCRTVQKNGFYFDFSGHLLHLRNEYVKQLLSSLLLDKFCEHHRRAYIHYRNCTVPFPFQANLSALPADVKKECLLGFIHSYCNKEEKSINTFEDWVHTYLGNGLAKHFFTPYNTKLYGDGLNHLTQEWCDQFIPKPSLEETVAGALGGQTRDFGYNVTFNYPKQGGIQILADSIAQRVNNIMLGVTIDSVRWKKKELETVAGETYGYESLVSTMPLPEMVNALDPLPPDLREAGQLLRWRTVHCINIGVKKRGATSSHWAYFPEPGFLFYRVGFIHNICEKSVPVGHSAYYVEIAADPNERVDTELLTKRSIEGLKTAGVLEQGDDIAEVQYLQLPHAYVVYDHARPAAVRIIKDFLERHDIHSVGRYGDWKYSAMENALLDGKSIAEKLKSR
jgi:protoporphyrinogen oxidase